MGSFVSLQGFTQKTPGNNNNNRDTVAIVAKDTSLATNDTVVVKKDSLQIRSKSDISTTIKYDAEDSIRLDAPNQKVYLFGKAKVNYGDITLEAEEIDIDWGTNIVVARGDTDENGKVFGIPVFKQGAETYTSNIIQYNFKTKKGIISKVVTQQGEGYIHGERVKRQDDMLYVADAHYTTCNLAEPHFYIHATKLKLIPDDKIVSGPFHLVVADIPTPLGFFLGIFPVPKKQKSGLIFPTYGENRDLGFFLSRGGWYFAINDYVNAQITGDIYSRGTYGLYGASTYRKRYGFSGNVGFNYFSQKIEEGAIVNRVSNYGILWNHLTETRGPSNLSANVNISSPRYYKINSFNPTARFANVFQSAVNYRRSFTGSPFGLNLAGRHSMNVNTKVQTMAFPEAVLTMNRIYPFKGKNSVGKAWYEKINVSYTGSGKFIANNSFNKVNRFGGLVPLDSGLTLNSTTLPAIIRGGTYYRQGDRDREMVLYGDRNSINPDLPYDTLFLPGAQFGAFHTIPISTSIKIKSISLNPSIVYNEYWFPRSTKYTLTNDTTIVEEVEKGFSRANSFSGTGISLTTNIYGTYNFKNSRLMALRHIVTPAIGYAYTPDFTTKGFGSYQTIDVPDVNRLNLRPGEYIVDRNNPNTIRLPRFKQFNNLYGFPSGRESSALSFAIRNVVQGKFRNPKDTANPVKRVSLLDNLELRGNYDFLRDSMKLSPILLSANTNVLDRFNINFNTTFDPYKYVETQPFTETVRGNRTLRNFYYRQTGEYLINDSTNARLGRFTQFSLSINTSLNPQVFKRKVVKDPTQETQVAFINAHPELYLDFTIPWNLFITYQATYDNVNFNRFTTHSLQFNGDVSVTEKWKLTFHSSYDLVNNNLPGGSFGIVRDLHCWQMSINVSKFGNNYIYFFNINPKSTLLQDLKLTKRSPQGLMNPYVY